MRIAGMALLLLTACGESPDHRRGIRVRMEPLPQGVDANLDVEHLAEADFERVTSIHPPETLADIVVSGTSFEKPTDVYVLRLRVKNSTPRARDLPRLWIRKEDEGETEILFRATGPSLEPGGSTELTYYWDPGRRVSGIDARLEWRP